MLSMGVGAILLISMICAYTGTEEHMPSKEEKSGRRNDCDSCGLPITISDRATYKTIDGEISSCTQDADVNSTGCLEVNVRQSKNY